MRVLISGCCIILTLTASAFAEGDAENGEKVFRKCKACHAIGEGAKPRIGPVLNEIMGMQAGTHESFDGKYSKAMVEAGEGGLVWDEETLSTYLQKPKDLVEGTKMSFAGLKKDEDVADVIAYLLQFSPDYVPSE